MSERQICSTYLLENLLRGIQPCGSRRTGHNYAQTITRYENERIAYDVYWNDRHRGGARYTDNGNIHRTHHTLVGRTRRNAESDGRDFPYQIGLWDHHGSSWAFALKSIRPHRQVSGVGTNKRNDGGANVAGWAKASWNQH